jgi:transcriptional regulator of nitric oxide reductase
VDRWTDGRAGRREPSAARSIRLSVLLLLFAPTVAHAQGALGIGAGAPPKKVAASVERVFGPGTHVDTLRVNAAPVLRVARGDSLLGFAQVRNVRGKEQPITFLVAIDPTDHLKDVDVLVYREPYGGEVAYEPWRKQFRGRTAAEPLQVGHEIRGISGATISVNAVTAGVRQALAELTRWHQAGQLR